MDRKDRNITNPKRIAICDLAGKTTKAKSHTCKTKIINKIKTGGKNKKRILEPKIFTFSSLAF